MRTYFLAGLLLVGLFACQSSAPEKEKTIDELKEESKISSIIRNPVSADVPEDTVNVAKMDFEETTFDFGEVDEGAVIEHTFAFTNTGKVPLLISNARSTCGCTVPSWPKNPIAPGDGGEIKVKFNTKNKKNQQNKPVTITANTYPATTKVYVKGNVFPDPNKPDEKSTKQ